MTPQIPDDTLKEIHEALFANRKIQAIKHYREATGQGLYESKTAVEAIDAELRAANPDKFLAQRTGCMGVLALTMLLLTGVAVAKIIA
jgi:hypothetical protein